MAKKDIITGVVALVAIALVVIVVLISTGVIGGDKEDETVVETSVVHASRIDENGNIEYYTMVTEYTRPKASSGYTYPVKPAQPTTEPVTEPSTTLPNYVEYTSAVTVLDENGNPVLDENGVPLTSFVSYTEIATQPPPPPTQAVQVTDQNGNPVLDENGVPVTEMVTVGETTTRENGIWTTSETESKRFDITPPDVGRDDALASNLIAQINFDREGAGLPPLTENRELTISARSSSTSRAVGIDDGNSRGYILDTSYGGQQIYIDMYDMMSSAILSADSTQVGVGVAKMNGQYFTTIIIQ